MGEISAIVCYCISKTVAICPWPGIVDSAHFLAWSRSLVTEVHFISHLGEHFFCMCSSLSSHNMVSKF